MARNNKTTTRDEIVCAGAKLFMQKGYSDASAKALCDVLNISTGNLTYYFPTKDHLFRVMVRELCRFQWKMFRKVTSEGQDPVMAACLELAAMAAACEEDPVVRDFYLAAYTRPLTLEIIRQEDCCRAKEMFGRFCGGWTDASYVQAEVLVSGIEFATLMQTPGGPPLEDRIRSAAKCILQLYGVPARMQDEKLEKVLAMDYRSLGRSIFRDFTTYLLRETGLTEEAHLAT